MISVKMGRMIYLVDGHNLIPHVPGLSLRALDDELHLVRLLQAFSREKRAQVEVYFDGAPAGRPGVRSFGTLRAHFIRASSSADEAIRARLRRSGARSSQFTVVTSDRQVQADARSHRAAVLDSPSFAAMLLAAQESHPPAPDEPPPLGDIDEWLRLFGEPPK
jgi:predicted RNA-binding protein with PIN domain